MRYEDCKREVTSHESNADSNKKKNKNDKIKNWEEQATHTIQEQTIEILKLLITKNQIVSEQKIIKQQALLYFFFIQMLWYQVFVQLLAWLFIASIYSYLFCTDQIQNIISIYMNISHSHVSSDDENKKKSTNEKQLILRTFSTHSKTSSADVSVQTESLTMTTQQTIWYLILFSASDVSDASYFNESDMTRFLNQFKLLSKNHEVKNVILIKKLLKYCESENKKKVKMQENYITADWKQLQ